MTEKSSGEDSLLPRDALGHVAKAMGLHSLAVQQGSSCPVSSVSRVVKIVTMLLQLQLQLLQLLQLQMLQ